MRVGDLVPWRSRTTPARRTGEYDPFAAMRQDMNRMFEDFFSGFDMAPFERERFASFSPSVDVSETDSEIEAVVELPGMSEEDIDLTLTRDGLTITGEKKEETEEEGKNFFQRERSYGYFRRTIPLPADAIDRENVSASFDKGILKVTLPKREETQEMRKRIEVKSGE
jgi:HSP20 family protein